MILPDAEQLLELFRLSEGFTPVLRDPGLLVSSVQRPHIELYGKQMYPTLHLKVAALADSISRNRQFLDGNKRLALLAVIAAYWMNGYRRKSTYSEDELYDIFLRAADQHFTVEQLAVVLERGFPVQQAMTGDMP